MLTLFRRPTRDPQADWYIQAHCLRRLGYHSAAVFSMRAAIERQLTRLAMMHRDWIHSPRTDRRGIDALTVWLMSRGLLSKSHKRQFQHFAEKANKAAHGKLIDRHESLRLLRQAKQLRQVIDAGLRSVLAS